ncbi:MAG: N-acetylglucosamine-6-phosphate deacetylase [Lentisphaerae bacterium ADurb.Bin242]|nr:MAG: N-acetylglucosamine-6-phosphate deacetylase [Lentisphaerae bacterium ADurb.Bin242]
MRTLLRNGRLVSPDRDHSGSILLDGDKIERIFLSAEELPPADREIDLAGKTVLPGFIDIHSHGRGGADFCDGTPEAFETIGNGKLSEGVTSFLATTLTVSVEDITKTCRCAETYRRNNRTGARLLGMHLEGPFIAPEGAGAQNPDFLLHPDIALVRKWDAVCPVKKVSFSPELPGSMEFIRALREIGIMPSGAHSLAEYETFELARAAGMKHLTHFCNVLTPLHHLKFGFVGGGLRSGDVFVEIICDGVHLCDEMIDLILKVKGSERVMIITDAMRAAGMPDGIYDLGGLPVQVRNGKATLSSGRVAGSTGLFDGGFRKVLEVSGLPPREAVKCTSWNQAQSLNLGRRGRLEPGYEADLAVMDSGWHVLETWVGGVPRWKKA